jgi:hypothetical protein
MSFGRRNRKRKYTRKGRKRNAEGKMENNFMQDQENKSQKSAGGVNIGILGRREKFGKRHDFIFPKEIALSSQFLPSIPPHFCWWSSNIHWTPTRW